MARDPVSIISDTAPHYLLNGIAGWRAASLDKVTLSNQGLTLSLPLMPGAVRPLVDAAGSFGGLQAALGVAVDRQDRVYVLDGSACALKRFDRCSKQFVTLPCIGGEGSCPRQLSHPHGLAISRRNDIYIADTGNRRVQIFSVKGLTLRWIWGPLKVSTSPRGIRVEKAVPAAAPSDAGTDCQSQIVFPRGTWLPWDAAVSDCNWTYVSDYANGLIHVFDSHGCWRTAYTGAGPSSPPLVKPTRLALDRDGRIYVIQENQDYVVVLDSKGNFAGTIQKPEEVEGRFCPVAVAVDVQGNLCLSDCITQKIYFYRPDEAGAWCTFRCCGSLGAFAASMIFDASGNPIFADGARSVCQLSPPAAYPIAGAYYSEALDSKTYRCIWHRVLLSGCIFPGTAVRVDTFTSESAKPIDEIITLPENRWATGESDTDTENRNWDCLIQSPPGRFLWLRLKLTGDGVATPTIEKVKVYYPRASSLRYLPAIYRQDSTSGDFLDRFLSIFDTIRGKTSDQITTIARYFDPKATPANPRNAGGTDFLSWLAAWLGMSLQNNWPVAKRRELVRQAHRLYALRGTREGLRLHIEVYAGVRPRILELFRLRKWFFLNRSRLGDCTALFAEGIMERLQVGTHSRIGSFRLIDYGNPSLDLFNAQAYQFLVVVPRWPGANQGDQQTLQQIIDMAKPAHTLGQFQWAEPRLRVGLQAFVGVDTVIGKYPLGVIEGRGKLGHDTVLGTPGDLKRGPSMRVSETSRIGCNTRLN